MKCVAEIMMIKNEAEREEEKRKMKQKETDKRLKQERIKNTILYCETVINDYFVANAKKRLLNPFCIRGVQELDSNGEKVFRPLKKVPSSYSDHKEEHRINDIEEKSLDLGTLVDYLSQFCYKIKIEEGYYFIYGYGSHTSIDISISV